MSTVFANIGLSLDGYMVPEGMALKHWNNPEYLNWGAQWGALMAWILNLEHFRSMQKIGPGGETGPVNDLLKQTSARIGANIMGKRMFDGGEIHWPEEAPFHTPVYVLTSEKRKPWERPGGTTFYFENEGPLSALEKARKDAGSRDIRICGGPNVIQQYLRAGLIEELEIALSPVLFGAGLRLFENVGASVPGFKIDRVVPSPLATHIRYVRA